MSSTTATGFWGEATVVKELRALGWTVEWDGGFTRGRDLRATRDRQEMHVQVKTTTAPSGHIAWRGDGERARRWAEATRSRRAVAIFALVHMLEPAEVVFDLDSGLMTVKIPANYSIAVRSAEAFADDVDAARAAYGSSKRQRRGRNGEPVGALLSPDGLAYPVYVSDYSETLDSL